MSDLLDRIRTAQVRAGEEAVLDNLRSMGLAPRATTVTVSVNLLTNIAQLMDAWKNTAPEQWTDWDQEQRDAVSGALNTSVGAK